MRLTACILTRDEPDDLRRALASLAPLAADETLVVANDDTSPATHAAARDHGARVVPIRWSRDFAAARNAGLDAAAGDWVFWLDTDEVLLTPDPALFRGLMADPAALAYYVRIEDHGTGTPMTERHHRSLLRRRPDVRYVGRVHEHFEPPLEHRPPTWRVAPSGIRVRHAGYAPARTADRLRRNVGLMDLELHDRPGQLYYLIELGRSLLLLNDPRGHAHLADAATRVAARADAPAAPIPLVATLLEYALAHAPPDFPLPPDRAAALAERWFPSSPPVLWRTAQWHYRRGHYAAAAGLLRSVLDLGRSGAFDRDVPFDRRLFGDETLLNLGVCLARSDRGAAARECFEALAARPGPFAAVAAANLQRLTSALG